MRILKKLWQKYASQHDVAVLGGGVSGITTAVVLQSLGFNPIVVTEYVTHEGTRSRPFVPSDFAMATAYPHELKIADFDQVTADSQSAFASLAQVAGSGVSKYRMFEVFEHEPVMPASVLRRMNARVFDGTPAQLKNTINPPVREGAGHVWGWQFDTYFVDMPVYMRTLFELFVQRGGVVERAHLDAVPDTTMPVINCLGFGSIEVFDDLAPANIMRGLQVLVPNAPMVEDADGMPICYNYTPSAEIYSRADGSPEYVHFFPRQEEWVLGQSREPGTVDADGNWFGAEVRSAEPIIDLNESLLNSWKNLSLDVSNLQARAGYRYYRDFDNTGVRLEAETKGSSLIIHNYGHGGSGVTVSWGCAAKCAQLLLDKTSPRNAMPFPSVQENMPWIFGH